MGKVAWQKKLSVVCGAWVTIVKTEAHYGKRDEEGDNDPGQDIVAGIKVV